MPGGGPGEGRARISVNVAESRKVWLDAEAARLGALFRLYQRLTASHCVRASIEAFARLSEAERASLVARFGGDGELEAGPEPPAQRT